MRKNKFMRAASGLLVAVLLTTCVISGTFAKYVTSADGTDSARVARWGFTDTSITFDDLFKSSYDNVSGAEDVVAPGTTNSAQFKFDYTKNETAPEVAYKFKVDITGSNVADSIKNNKNIVWKLDNTEFVTSDKGTSWDQLMAAIKGLSGDASGEKQYAPGELPTGFAKGDNHTITWTWKFDDGSTTKDDAKNAQNVQDTAMGDADELAKVTLKITVTATQVD